jgi:outer membrane receptor protein involved in Fe transport
VRFQARVNNLLNRAQPRAYGSVVTSPLFGLPTGFTGGRTVNLSMNVTF